MAARLGLAVMGRRASLQSGGDNSSPNDESMDRTYLPTPLDEIVQLGVHLGGSFRSIALCYPGSISLYTAVKAAEEV